MCQGYIMLRVLTSYDLIRHFLLEAATFNDSIFFFFRISDRLLLSPWPFLVDLCETSSVKLQSRGTICLDADVL